MKPETREIAALLRDARKKCSSTNCNKCEFKDLEPCEDLFTAEYLLEHRVKIDKSEEFKYFASYVTQTGVGSVIGHITLSINRMIKSEEDFCLLAKEIANQAGVEKAVILNFKRLGVEE